MGSVSNVNIHSDDYEVKDAIARAHAADKNNPHDISAEQLGLGAFEDKTPSDIINTLTKEKIVSVLTYTPAKNEVESEVIDLQDRVDILEQEVEKDPFSELDIKIGLEVTDDGTLNVINHGTIHFEKGDSVTRAEVNKLNEQVRELFQFVSDVRSKLAAAVTDRGIYTRPDASFDEIINNIYQIDKGSGDLVKPIFGSFVSNKVGKYSKVNHNIIKEFEPRTIFTPAQFKEYIEGGGENGD